MALHVLQPAQSITRNGVATLKISNAFSEFERFHLLIKGQALIGGPNYVINMGETLTFEIGGSFTIRNMGIAGLNLDW
ncbi:hypothetical protein ACFLQW_00775 [Candidatus Zixiibacteriota bacterium]